MKLAHRKPAEQEQEAAFILARRFSRACLQVIAVVTLPPSVFTSFCNHAPQLTTAAPGWLRSSAPALSSPSRVIICHLRMKEGAPSSQRSPARLAHAANLNQVLFYHTRKRRVLRQEAERVRAVPHPASRGLSQVEVGGASEKSNLRKLKRPDAIRALIKADALAVGEELLTGTAGP